MLLLIDAGNTQIKWALLDAARTPKLGDWEQMGSLSHQALSVTNPPWTSYSIHRVVVSNVAGKTAKLHLEKSLRWPHRQVEWITSQPALAGVKNQYINPAQLGSDRFAAAIAARALHPGKALIVATCGTALTIDAVTAAGEFVGGMIVPGLKMMSQALSKNTAMLPLVTTYTTKTAHFADHTEAAIMSGCVAAQAGAIEHAAREFAIATETDPLCVVSGGGAKYILPSLNIPHQHVDNLVLIGLQVIS